MRSNRKRSKIERCLLERDRIKRDQIDRCLFERDRIKRDQIERCRIERDLKIERGRIEKGRIERGRTCLKELRVGKCWELGPAERRSDSKRSRQSRT